MREVWIEIIMLYTMDHESQSLPVREVWIEMCSAAGDTCYLSSLSLPVREVWIEIKITIYWFKAAHTSLPVREVWIEIASA